LTGPALQAPLRLAPRSSLKLALYLLLIHGAAALILLSAVPSPPWLRLGLWVLLAGSLHWSWQMQVTHQAHAAIVQAVWDREGAWELTVRSGERVEAELLPDSFVTLPLVVLNFSTSRWRRRSLVLTADNTDPELLRQLRVRLRLEFHPSEDGRGM
jgi:toxin CptA